MTADRHSLSPEAFRSRYPGTQPFSDSADDRARFFGRDEEAEQLYLRILSVPLLVQFGKSGVGKTSLLQAGVFPRLRMQPYLPVMVRLNVADDSLLQAVIRSIQESCEADGSNAGGLELTLGDTDGLWEYLSTTTVWRHDLLLTPVLVFDQFEEVFTLRDAAFRAEVAAEIGALASGVPPVHLRTGQPAARPAVKIVISLRDDYVGALEEFSVSIPGLFQERLRLEPLTEITARSAITGPARLVPGPVEKPYTSPPFELEPAALESMINYLKGNFGVLEPFQLQLLCNHAERIASRKGAGSDHAIVLTLADFLGAQRFASVLNNFYHNTLAKISSPPQQRKAAALCEDGLLAASGHRLMLEEGQILGEYKLSRETLTTLCNERLLRRERRLDSVFYEISHDRLAESILAARRTKLPKKIRQSLWATAVVTLAIVGALMMYNRRIGKERESAQKERDSAERLISFLLGEQFLGEVRDAGRSTMLTLVKDEVDKNDGVTERSALNRGLALRNSGDIAKVNGYLVKSIALYNQALAIFENSPGNQDTTRERARTHERIAEALAVQGRHRESLSHFAHAEQAWRRVIAKQHRAAVNTNDCIALAKTVLNAAYAKHRMGEPNVLADIDSAFRIASNVLFGGTGLCGAASTKAAPYPDAGAVGLLQEMADTRGLVYGFGEDSEGAAALAQESSALRPESMPARSDALTALASRGAGHLAENPEKALSDYREVQEGIEELRRWDPQNRLWQRNRAANQLLISEAIVECHKQHKKTICKSVPSLEDAEAISLEALEQLRALIDLDSSNIDFHNDVMWALQVQASVLEEKGLHEESLTKLREGQRVYLGRPRDKSDIESAILYAFLLRDIAGRLLAAKQVSAAAETLRVSTRSFQTMLDAHPGNPTLLYHMSEERMLEAELMRAKGNADAATTAEREAKTFFEKSQAEAVEWERERARLKSVHRIHFERGARLLHDDPGAALAQLTAAEAAVRDYIRLRPAEFGGYVSLRETYASMADAYRRLGDDGGENMALNASMNAAQLAAWLSPEESVKEMNTLLLNARSAFSRFLYRVGRREEALTMMQEVVAVAARLAQSSPADWRFPELLGSAQCDLGQIRRGLEMAGWEEAIRSGVIRIESAAAIAQDSASLFNKAGEWRIYLATQLDAMGQPRNAQEERRLALGLYRQAIRLAPADKTALKAISELQKRIPVPRRAAG